MPMYDSLRQQGIRTDAATGIRVFAGQSAETFAIDLGAVFDTVNLRVENATPIPMFRPPLPVQTAAEDANDFVNPFGVNAFSGFNVNSIAIEVPISRLTQDGGPANTANGTIGIYASTSRQMTHRARRRARPVQRGPAAAQGRRRTSVQVSRMANPLVNELIIRIGRKDFWNATDPADEAQFLDAYQALDVAGALQRRRRRCRCRPRRATTSSSSSSSTPGRAAATLSELLRLDMTVPPTPPAQIKRLGPFAHDAVGSADARPRRLPERPPPERRRHRHRRARRRRRELHPELRRRRRRREREGHHARLPVPPEPYDGRNRRHVDPGEPS